MNFNIQIFAIFGNIGGYEVSALAIGNHKA
jgi:hypothetical protein